MNHYHKRMIDSYDKSELTMDFLRMHKAVIMQSSKKEIWCSPFQQGYTTFFFKIIIVFFITTGFCHLPFPLTKPIVRQQKTIDVNIDSSVKSGSRIVPRFASTLRFGRC